MIALFAVVGLIYGTTHLVVDVARTAWRLLPRWRLRRRSRFQHAMRAWQRHHQDRRRVV